MMASRYIGSRKIPLSITEQLDFINIYRIQSHHYLLLSKYFSNYYYFLNKHTFMHRLHRIHLFSSITGYSNPSSSSIIDIALEGQIA